MTPLAIEIMLHYYSCITDYRHGYGYDMPRATQENIDWLIKNEMLKRKPCCPPVFEITPRGNVYVETLAFVPLPECDNAFDNFSECLSRHGSSDKIKKGVFTDCIREKIKIDKCKATIRQVVNDELRRIEIEQSQCLADFLFEKDDI